MVGSDRLPTFDDLPKLEYVRAIASETLRWRPVAVLGGTPHSSTADYIYKGMFIPKGSTIIAPLWTRKYRVSRLGMFIDGDSSSQRGRFPPTT